MYLISSVLNQISKPYRVTSTPDSTMYEFYRVDSNKVVSFGGDRSIKTECAIIDIHNNKREFTLTYYPIDKSNHLVVTLPMSELGQAITDLKKAGF